MRVISHAEFAVVGLLLLEGFMSCCDELDNSHM